jgi:hypothetical protein
MGISDVKQYDKMAATSNHATPTVKAENIYRYVSHKSTALFYSLPYINFNTR